MFLKGMLLVIVGIIIFSISLAISYEIPDFPSVAYAIIVIIGFALIFYGAYIVNKSTQKK